MRPAEARWPLAALMAGCQVLCLASGCQSGLPVAARHITTSAPQVAASARVTPPAPVSTSTSTSIDSHTLAPPSTSPSARPVAHLVKPAGAVVLSGHALVDATYLVSAGLGTLAANGNGVIANNGGNLVSDNGGSVISNNSSGIVANNGGGLIANNGGNVIADGGLNDVTAGAAQLVPEGGGALVAPGGVPNHASYRLADVSAAPSASAGVASGGNEGLLPAAGVRISVLSLSTNTPVPIGKDAKGQPVYTLYTAPDGTYELYLAPDLAPSNVRVVANMRLAPDGSNPLADPDPHLRLDTVARAGREVDLDDENNVVSSFLFEGLVSQLVPVLSTTNVEWSSYAQDHLKNFIGLGSTAAVIGGVLAKLNQAAIDAHLPDAPPDVVKEAARRIIQSGLAGVDLSSINVDAKTFSFYQPDNLPGGKESAVATLRDVLRATHENALAFLPPARQDYFYEQSFFLNAVCLGHVSPDFRIGRPSDLLRFMLQAFLEQSGYFFDDLESLLRSIGADNLPPTIHAPGATQANRLEAATVAIQQALMLACINQTDENIQFIQKHPYTGPAQASPTPIPTCRP